MIERSVFDNSFLSLVERWFAASGELFVVIRYSHMGGAKDYLLMHSFSEFVEKLRSLPPRADVSVFRERQLPVRGIADDALLAQALAEIPDGVEWRIEEYDPAAQAITRWLWGGTERQELIESFEKFKGLSVAVGRTPVWWVDDNDDMQSALVPMPDSSLVRGIY